MPQDNAQCNEAWLSLSEKLKSLKSFRIHTGNVNNYVELKLKRFKDSAEELIACLDLQFAKLKPGHDLSDDGMLLLAEPQANDTDYDRDDLKITLKVFLQTFDFAHIESSVDSALKQLQTENIEQLIIAFPEPDSNDNSVLDQKWFDQVLSIWKHVEDLLASQKVISAGVAEFQLVQLKALYEAAKTKPALDHFNIDSCCVVPPDLNTYAKDNDIQLLTHNDPNPFPLRDVFRSFCNPSATPGCPNTAVCSFEPTWAARYTVWVRRRSLMAAKGYIVQFTRA
jgi:glutamate--cysteine ligase regulatory subunit